MEREKNYKVCGISLRIRSKWRAMRKQFENKLYTNDKKNHKSSWELIY